MGPQENWIGHFDYYPCIFMVENIIFMIYVNDFILFTKEDKYIDAFVAKIRYQKFLLEY